MKKNLLSILLTILAMQLYGQDTDYEYSTDRQQQKSELRTIVINEDVSTHFILSEEVDYVDMSVDNVAGDIPVKNVVRIKPVVDSLAEMGMDMGIITIVTKKYMVQYKLMYGLKGDAHTNVQIGSMDAINMINPLVSMSEEELETLAKRIRNAKPTFHAVKTRNSRMEITLNNVITIEDYFFIDLSLINRTNIQYDIDQLRFKIVDKKQVKSTNYQELEIHDIYRLDNREVFKKKYSNILVFKKFTFPDEKIFTIEIAEKQISGRTITLNIDYMDILKADAI